VQIENPSQEVGRDGRFQTCEAGERSPAHQDTCRFITVVLLYLYRTNTPLFTLSTLYPRRRTAPRRRMMILYLFKYSIQTNHQIKAVHQESNPHQDNQRNLIITQRFSRRAFSRSKRTGRPRDIAIPRNSRCTRTRNGGRKEIVETERKRGRP
jgi:hypothetical protein